ncbi:MFS transporter [Actinomadura craniellae]|uniref:MFS transporter n=1 Tax=Actinomadura craniellae TaxID=2231787 RepID=A0A365H6P3_9ACTN|nr:MFS transporter [Actinomadura craniellae]RAY14757.1 MFS transporter [Actinomadura craniellae]
MSSDQARTGSASLFWTAAGLVLLGLNLRAALTSIAPVLEDVQGQFGLPSAGVGLLATLPVLCLGVFALIAPRLARRLGAETVLAGALLLIAVGVGVRLLPTVPALFAGTALAGIGIAVGNVVAPYVVKDVFPQRIGLFTGLVMMLLAVGAALATGLAVPLAELGTWRLATGVWAVPALVAAAIWAPLAVRWRRGATVPAAARTVPGGSLLRTPLAWAITGFMGLQSLMFYSLMTWLPAIMQDNGHSPATSGMMLSVILLLGIPAGIVVPVLLARVQDQRLPAVLVCLLPGIGLAGMLLAPGAGWIWSVIVGVGTGCALPLVFTLISLRSATPLAAAGLAGLAQGVGYLLAALGPFTFGALHDATGGWEVPLVALAVLVLPQALCGWRAGRPGELVGGPVERLAAVSRR